MTLIVQDLAAVKVEEECHTQSNSRIVALFLDATEEAEATYIIRIGKASDAFRMLSAV